MKTNNIETKRIKTLTGEIEIKYVKTVTGKEICSLEDLRDYINEDEEDYPNDVEEICKAMGWIIPTENIDDLAVDLEHNQLLRVSEGSDDSCEVVNPFTTGISKYKFAVVISRDNGTCTVESLHEDIASVDIESRWPKVIDGAVENPDTWIRVFDLEKTFYVADSIEDLPFYGNRELLEYAKAGEFAGKDLGGDFAGFIQQAQVDCIVCNYKDLGLK